MCLGQVMGVHLAEKGMEALGTRDPKKIIVYVENDRRDRQSMRRHIGRRHAPEEDIDPSKIPALRKGEQASLSPAIPEPGGDNWLTRAKNKLLSALRKR